MNEKIETDRQTVTQFIHTMTADWANDSDQDGVIEIRCLGEDRTPHTAQFTMHAIDEAIDLAVTMNGHGSNIYMVVNPIDGQADRSCKGATDANILRAHFSFADADDERGLAGLKQLAALTKPDIVVRTGTLPSERYHAYWRLIEPCRNLSLWRQRQSDIARRYGTDPAVVNPSRLMRVAGTVAYPSAAKMARGYIPELTTLKVGAK